MRDLASRLRAIVKSEKRPRASFPENDPGRRFPLGEAGERGGEAEALPGEKQPATSFPENDARDRFSRFSTVEHLFPADQVHGHRRVAAFALDTAMPLGLFDPRAAAAAPDWASRTVFFDLETTGLSGGAGTLAFLVGCGWFEPDGFRVRQFLLTSAAGEAAMLDAVGEVLGAATLLVSYNGRTFDAPLMDMRWAFHRKPNPIAEVPHFDMLPSARRLWGRRGALRGAASNPDCSLSSIERAILGFHRTGDVPGFEIPSRYFHFLRSGDGSLLDDVLEHNRHDLLSLAGVTSHALALAREGPTSCRDAEEQLALGRLYERAGEIGRAQAAYEHAASAADGGTRQHALAHLAILLRRGGRFHEAADAWRRLLDLAGGAGRRGLSSLERQAVEALAIYHEHRARDLVEAKRYAEAMGQQALGAEAVEAARRLARLARKIERNVGRIGELTENTKGGPEAAPLLKRFVEADLQVRRSDS